jgi:hypothetical protein
MNRIFLIVVALLALASVSFARNITPTKVTDNATTSVEVWDVSDIVVDSINDTIAIGGQNVYGPIPLSNNDCNYASGFQGFFNNSTLATGDSAQFAYCITAGRSINDTLAFTATDTLVAATGEDTPYTALSSTAGKWLWVKIRNIDGTRIELQNRIKVAITYGCH